MKTTLCSLLTKPMFTQVSAWSHAYGRMNSIPGVPGSLERCDE
jgi:hypothetical protein